MYKNKSKNECFYPVKCRLEMIKIILVSLIMQAILPNLTLVKAEDNICNREYDWKKCEGPIKTL